MDHGTNPRFPAVVCRPKKLDLTAADEMVVLENMEVLRRNGFELALLDGSAYARGDGISGDGGDDINNDIGVEDDDGGGGGGGGGEMPGPRLHLVAQPVSKDIVFTISGTPFLHLLIPQTDWRGLCIDLEELLHLLHDLPATISTTAGRRTGSTVRCSKARAMFAMRACRRSVMIGRALDRARMTAVRGRRSLCVLANVSTASCLFNTPLLRGLDRAAYGNDGPAMELPTRPANDATPV